MGRQTPNNYKINGFPGLMVEHVFVVCIVKFGDPSCSGFWYIMQMQTQTDKRQ